MTDTEHPAPEMTPMIARAGVRHPYTTRSGDEPLTVNVRSMSQHFRNEERPPFTGFPPVERATEEFMGQPALNPRYRAPGAEQAEPSRPLPSVCPVCGAYSLAPEGHHSALLAVCDVLVHKALESMGKYIVRAERSRHREIGNRPLREAHTLWQPTDATVDKALKGAWDVVPALLDVHGCCDVTSIQVTQMLDAYVHDLAITGTHHSIDELVYRFGSVLGMPVFHRG